jgi:uncharacterized protein involved in cysteine biosynthesis
VNTTTKPSYGQPALVGGLVMGVLSALPLVNAFNVCCCGWVIVGGLVAAYVLQQNHPVAITPGDGALVGLLAGLIGAFVQVAVSIPINVIVGPWERALAERIADMAGTMPPEMRTWLDRYSRGGGEGPAFVVFAAVAGLVLWLVAGAIFSTIGGVIGAAIFKKSTPPGVIDIPPAS